MIKFKSISWQNFLSTGNSGTKVQLDRSTTTLIIGKNGEGKSTILDALCFSLFGKPFRNVKKGQLINSINQKNCVVEVEFEIGSSKYRVVRAMKPNKFEIYQNGELINQEAAARDYQKVLEQQILKLNYKTFTQVVILGSASFVPFMQLSSYQRKEVIEDILDIKIFSTMNQLLKERAAATKEAMTRVESEISNAKTKVDSQQTLIETISKAKTDSIKAIESKINQNRQTIAETTTEIDVLLADIQQLTESIESKDQIENDISKAATAKSKLNERQTYCAEHIEFYESNDSCPTCSQSLEISFKESKVSELQAEIEGYNAKVQTLEEALERLHADLGSIAAIQKRITDKNIELSTKNQTISILNTTIAELQKEIDDHKEDSTDLSEQKKILKDLAQEAMGHVQVKKQLLADKSVQEISSHLLKDTGIKTAIIREYLPIMNKLINKYLQAMDAYIHFELDEAFNEVVKSRFRDEFTYASFSEGEKMRIDLAILFTWRQIAKMKNSVNTNLLILDEIFDSSLDSAGTDYFLNLMSTMGENSNIFVISHKGDQLFDKFRSVIKFEKRNDFSVIAKG
jgi:DNA repair exonuclease SbcCD ATPase subunit